MSPAKLLAAVAAAGLSFAPMAWAADAPPAFAVTGVRVFDGEKVTPKATVVVRDGRVVAIGPKVAPPAGVQVIDGRGKTLLPGLIDAHTHTYGPGRGDALRFGVTTELDMFTHPATLRGLAAARDGMGPARTADLFSAGVLATAPNGHGTEYGFPIPTLTGSADADGWVKARIAEGSDYIKIVYEPHMEGRPDIPSLDKATLAAVVAAAHANGRLAVVHISSLQGARDSVEAGADGLAHTWADVAADPAFYRLAANKKVFVVPTLSVLSGFTASGEGARLAADPRIAPWLTTDQKASMEAKVRPSRAYHYAVAAGSVPALRAAGVDILAGTDAGNPTTTHGATLHEEVALLVAAGLTPVEALRAATSTPARRFKLAGRGRIAAGDRADLVLVEGDPTRDITATRAIAQVWKNGYPVERKPVAAAALPPTPLTGSLGAFEAGLAGPGATWTETSDRFVGGTSEAKVSRVSPGAAGSQGALRAEGVVRAHPIAWAGAQLILALPGTAPRDASGAKELVFRIKGTRSGGRAMLFDTSGPAPKTVAFAQSAEWSEVRLPLAGFAGANLKALVGVVICTDTAPGDFAFELDDVRLE